MKDIIIVTEGQNLADIDRNPFYVLIFAKKTNE